MRPSYLFLLLLLPVARYSFGQTSLPVTSQPAGSSVVRQQFCQLVRTPAGTLELDYGQAGMPPVSDAELGKAAARVRTTSSVISILNHLGAQGWTCVGVTTSALEAQPPKVNPFAASQPTATVNRVQTTYLLQRPLP